ncbi:MAG: hypothetical protein KDD69_09965 [Bdellovibrionales bacterium]|nr:hypothetical protein [Bdellovibrionales bacterium]
MKTSYRQTLIAAITFISGLYFFLEFVLPERIGEFEFGAYHDQISRGFQLIGVMAIGLGLINIFRVHGEAILKGRKGRGNSLALLLAVVTMFVVEGGDFLLSTLRVEAWRTLSELPSFSARVRTDYATNNTPAAARLQSMVQFIDHTLEQSRKGEGAFALVAEGKGADLSETFVDRMEALRGASLLLAETYRGIEQEPTASTLDDTLASQAVLAEQHASVEALAASAAQAADALSRLHYEQNVWPIAMTVLRESFFFPLGAAMFSLLAFYIATAAYRSFRIRSAEALIMMIAAVVVTLGQIPHGPLYVWQGLPGARLWMLENLSTPAFRAIFFGSAIAGLAMAVRMWLSLERSPLATEEAE